MDGFNNPKIEKSLYKIYQACRLCGSGVGSKKLINQNVNLDSGEVDLKHKVRECIQIEVHLDDKMSQLICELCEDKVNVFYEFLEMCRQTDKQMRLQLGLSQQTLPQEATDADDSILGITETIFVNNAVSNQPQVKSETGAVKPDTEEMDIQETKDKVDVATLDFLEPSPSAYSPLARLAATPSHSSHLVRAARSRSRSPLYKVEPRVLVESFERERTPKRGGRRGKSSSTVRGGRRVRGRARRRHQGWQPGRPLEEVCVTDDGAPLELREMVRDETRRRQAQRTRRATDEHNSESEDDEFYDAIDEREKSLLEGVDLHFEWSPMDTFRGVEETFRPARTGSVASYAYPYDAFRSFWDDDILQEIVDETNRHASQIQTASFQATWYPTNVHELLCLFAFWMMIGIIRMPTIASYFSSNSLLKTEIFSHLMTRQRYMHLNRALHFADTSILGSANTTNTGATSFDPLCRLRPVVDYLNNKFQSNYILSKDICIDESLTIWKGRIKSIQNIRSRVAEFGLKTFELCESGTGYLWSFVVYTGRQDSELGIEKSAAIVLKLIRPLLNKGYRLFMDNWFNSPLLARILKRNGTDCVGTLRESRVDVPRLVTCAPLEQGQLVARHSGDVCVLSWLDKKRVNIISTCHGSATGLPRVSSRPPARPEQFKPQSVLDYNRCIGGVDLKDQMLEPYLLERKRCSKWYHKLFKSLLNCSINNSRVLLESSLKARQDNLKFRLELVHAIISNHHKHVPLSRRAAAPVSRAPIHPVVKHTHWPVRHSTSAIDLAQKRNTRKKCVVCLQEGRKQQRSYYKCEECDVALCVDTCFKSYHTTAFK